jgi:hypoxanthine phosphoribosyltransferase
MYLTFAKNKIDNADHLPFDPAEYSRFKFGDGSLAKKFGEELALDFIETHKELLLTTANIVIVPSPYNSIPTASGLMSTYFKDTINHFLFTNNKELLLESKIHRYNTYSVDYSKLNYDERLKLMASDTYHFHESFLNNKTCLFVDDIRVTGSHEQIIKNILEVNKLSGQFIFIYYAAFNNNTIPPNLESYLNTYSIKSLSDVATVIKSANFSPNTRIIKYILNSNHTEVVKLFEEMDISIATTIVKLALSNNYHQMPEYKKNFYALAGFIGLYS